MQNLMKSLDPELLEAIEEWVLSFEQKINVGPVQGEQDEFVQSTAGATVDLMRHLRSIITPDPADTQAMALRDEIAKIIAPEWFGDLLSNGNHILDNYPGQHKSYQDRARGQANVIMALLGR